ncbi:exoribonuclease II [Mycoplasmopsis fermentans]|nr:exoribonuclease II [Mycoplasmopsis fermentans]
MKFAEYMQSKIGKTYIGMVTYITSFGIFVRLDNTIEGCAKHENIKGDFYEFDQDKLIYKGKNTNKILSLGTKVEIKVIGSNKTNRKIDFEITKIF